MTLKKQIDNWYRSGEHQEIINAILNLTDMEITDALTEDLAVAYNNLGKYQEAIDALKKTERQNRTSPHWHYCMGYALYYSAMACTDIQKQYSLLHGALDAFTSALKRKPEKELEAECREFTAWIQEDLCKLTPHATEQEGAFACSVLLSSPWFDTDKFLQDFHTDWAQTIPSADCSVPGCCAFSIDNIEALIALIPSPVPDQDAKKAAARNYLWPNAARIAQNHKAHLLITLSAPQASLLDRGLLFVKIIATCCLQLSALGIFVNGALYQLGLFRNMASVIKDELLPVPNWVWIGLYKTEQGLCGYTYGLRTFGKEEIEVLDTNAGPAILRAFLQNISTCILEEHIILQAGDTLKLSQEQNLPITLSDGVALSGTTLKIPYYVS